MAERSANELRVALQTPPPRSLDGSAPYLSGARFSFRMGMVGALLFMVPFVTMVVTDVDTLERKLGALIGLGLIWLLPPLAFLRYRMRHINRLWREGRVVNGVLTGSFIHGNRNGAPGTVGRFRISFTTPGGQERAAVFFAETSDFANGQPPQVVTVEDVSHRAGLIGARALLVGECVPAPK